jgi:hypothetical protein
MVLIVAIKFILRYDKKTAEERKITSIKNIMYG